MAARLITTGGLQVSVEGLTSVPLVLGPVPRASVYLGRLRPVRLRKSTEGIVFTDLDSVALSSCSLGIRMIGLFSARAGVPCMCGVPMGKVLFDGDRDNILGYTVVPRPGAVHSGARSGFMVGRRAYVRITAGGTGARVRFLASQLGRTTSLAPRVGRFLIPGGGVVIFGRLPGGALKGRKCHLRMARSDVRVRTGRGGKFFCTVRALLRLLPPRVCSSAATVRED